MELKRYLENLYDYNYWANHRYLAVVETLTEEQFFRKQGHSWDSVQAVLVHMLSSERMWPQRWRGEKAVFLDPKDFPTIASVRGYWVEVEKNMRLFLAEQTEQSLLRGSDVHKSQGRNVHAAVMANDGTRAESQYAPSRRAGGDVHVDEYSASRRGSGAIFSGQEWTEAGTKLKTGVYESSNFKMD